MSKDKHTPGPWDIAYVGGIAVGIGTSKTNGPFTTYKMIANTLDATHSDDDLAEVNANAQLIAAAPEMYEALKMAMRIPDLWCPVGEPEPEHEEEDRALGAMFDAFGQALAKIEESQQ